MRSDLPEDLKASIAKLPPGLREAAERAADARYPTEAEELEERRARDNEARKKHAEHQRDLAGKVGRALDGEWGDDVRRAVDEAVAEVRAPVQLLVDWERRHRRRDEISRIEWAAIRQAFESRPVCYALEAANRLIREAARERREASKR